MSWQLYTPENAHLDPLASFRGYSLVNTILRQHGLFPYEVFYVHHLSSKRRPQRASIWVVDLMSPAGPNNFPVEAKPFTTPLHWTGADRLIIRILLPTCPNLVHKNRIVNEVASMHLIRQGLKKAPDGLADVVPAVYSWGVSKADPEKGWMIMEYKRGLRLNSILPTMDQEAVDIAIGRIAQLLSYIQKTPLPATNAHTGGLALDLDGKVKLGNMTTLPGGPWDSYSGFWAAKINAQLAHAKLSAQVDRPNYSIREETRLLCQAHLRDISQLFHNSLVDEGARAMIHGSLTMDNILYDPQRQRIAALLDFDFACISHPSMEFLSSFADIGGNVMRNLVPGFSLNNQLIHAAMTGYFKPEGPYNGDKVNQYWHRAKTWDGAMAKFDAITPSEINGIDTISLIARIASRISPITAVGLVPVDLRMVVDRTAEQAAETHQLLMEELRQAGVPVVNRYKRKRSRDSDETDELSDIEEEDANAF